MPEQPRVRPGQVWADNDPRSAGRTLRVIAVGKHSARCEVVSSATDAVAGRGVGRTHMIALARFRPTSNGYRLITDVED